MKENGLGGFGKGLSMKPSIMRMTIDRDGDNDDDEDESFKPDLELAGNFVGRILTAAGQVHMLHLQTDSYAKHLALHDLYTSIPADIDLIAEEFQGCYDVIPSYDTYAPFNANPVIYVQELLDFVKANKKSMGPSSSMKSNIDYLETSLKTCLYKLKKLK